MIIQSMLCNIVLNCNFSITKALSISLKYFYSLLFERLTSNNIIIQHLLHKKSYSHVVHKLSYYTYVNFEIKTGKTLLKQKTYKLHIFIIQKNIICQQQFVIIHLI